MIRPVGLAENTRPPSSHGAEGITFVCAGALQNAVSNFEAKGKEVHILGATAIIQALLCLIGIRPEVFKTKVA